MSDNQQGVFLHGLAYSVGFLIDAHMQTSIALDLLNCSGFTYADLVKAKCATYDLNPTARTLGLRLDGSPLQKTARHLRRASKGIVSFKIQHD